jgi:cysteinyl-tRNA synthetase
MRRVTIYDTLSRESRLFVPRFPPRVGMFVCGLTPYDEAHIGHARVAVVFDIVARALARWGYRVLYVQNVTNIDDKLLGRAGQLGVDPFSLSDRHFAQWREAMERLGVRSVQYYPHATDYVPEILEQIGQLVDRGFAYRTDDGSVYYEVAKFPGYGKLSGQKVEALRPGARLEIDRHKHAPEDFVLWKAATPGEPSWESPWGPGRPGWHIEDTAITARLLGPRYDLHGGGLDLKFPHHEAEIAQAEAATGLAPLVNFWMHAGLVSMGGEKMSKSLGNVYSLTQALDEFGPMVLRFYYLNAHYRSPLEFTRGESLEAAREAYARLSLPYRRLRSQWDQEAPERVGEDLPEELASASADLVDHLDETLANDFQTREVIAQLFVWGHRVAEWLPKLDRLSSGALSTLAAPYRWVEETLGLFEEVEQSGSSDLAAAVGVAIEARTRARTRGDFTEADRIRDALRAAGIELEDDATGTRWERTGSK